MNNEHLIPDILAEVRKLRGLVGALFAQKALDDTAATASPVDFVVDIFDRQDTDGIGGYWEHDDDYVLRSNRVIEAWTPSLVSPPAQISSLLLASAGDVVIVGGNGAFTYDREVDTRYITQGATTNRPYAFYANPLTSNDLIIEITFDGPNEPVLFSSNPVNQFFPAAGNYDQYIGAFATAGAAFGSKDSGAKIGGFIRSARYVSTEDVKYVGWPATTTMNLILGNLAASIAQLQLDVDLTTPQLRFNSSTGDSVNGTTASGQSTMNAAIPSVITSSGSNALRFVASGGVYTLTVNGETFYDQASSLLAIPDKVGICTPGLNVLGMLAASPLFQVRGITSFKAWRADQPEPPSESGHGVLVEGQRRYSDKFHTPVVDTNGNITGYTYNPGA
jgi:hypothetical protein